MISKSQLIGAPAANVFADLIDRFRSEPSAITLEHTYDLNEKYLPYFPSRVHVPDVAFIVARTDSDVIGCENQLPWRMRSDLRRFKELTSHHAVIMGRKTYESIGKPLPNRFNIVITRDRTYLLKDVATFSNVRDALLFSDILSTIFGCEKTFVIGGGEIFSQFTRCMSLLFLTQIHDRQKIEGDSFFSYRIDRRSWAELFTQNVPESEVDQFASTFSIFRKKRTGERSRSMEKVQAGIRAHRNELIMVGSKYHLDKRVTRDTRQLRLFDE